MLQTYFNPSVGETVSPVLATNAVPATTPAAPAPTPAAENLLPTLADHTVAFSVFKSEKDNNAQARKLTWSEFAKQIKKHTARKTKEGTGAFSPVTYRARANRGNDGVETITMAVFDVDGGVTPDAIKSLLGGFAYVLHSTWSHAPDKPSYRVIVPFTTPVLKQDWQQVWPRLNLFLGGINDPATKDPARIYYLPSHPEGRDDFFVEVGEGKPLDVADLPELPPAERTQIQSVSNSSTTSVKIEGIEDIPRDFSAEAGLHEMCNRCVFMQQVSQPENQNTVSEPHWKAMISNAACFENSDEWIHEASCHHDGYSEAITDKSIKRFRDGSYGPTTCQRIQTLGFTGCPAGGCKTLTGKITKAPAGLRSWAMQQQPATKGKLSKKDHVNNIVDKFNGLLRYVNHEPYSYSNGHWPMLDEQVDVTQVIAHYLGEGVSRCGINELLFLVQTFQANAEAAVAPDLNLICLLNGTLDLRRGELIEHSPEHNLKCQINCIWDPSVGCPRWDYFLEEIFVDDSDSAEKIQLLQEWFGYCLTLDNSQHKFLWLVGAGGNGKSVILNILTHLVGPRNISNAHIERLGDKGVRAELENKLVNISAEMGAQATIADSYLKEIVAGDVIEAERKFRDSFSFRPTVRLVGSTNHLPRLLDLSDGFFRRAMILQFNRKFEDGERDPKLTEKLISESSGILAWALQGLKNLRERGYFVIPKSSIEALNQYKQDSDPERMFFDECLLDDPTGEGMSPKSLYAGYGRWCKVAGHRAKAKINLGKRLTDLGTESLRGHSGKRWLVKPSPASSAIWDRIEV